LSNGSSHGSIILREADYDVYTLHVLCPFFFYQRSFIAWLWS